MVLRAAPHATQVQLFNEDDLQEPGPSTALADWPPTMRWLSIEPVEEPIASLHDCVGARYIELVISPDADIAGIVASLPQMVEQLQLETFERADALKAFVVLAAVLTTCPAPANLPKLRHLTFCVAEMDRQAALTDEEETLKAACGDRGVVLSVVKLPGGHLSGTETKASRSDEDHEASGTAG